MMPLALESSGGDTNRKSKFIHGMPSIMIGDRSFPADREADSDSSSSSSIGRNSDSSEESSDQEDSGENEVQSSYKEPLDSINALEEVLPVKKGISSFYKGKSKSFTNLADVSTATSIQDIAKTEDPYAKKRKNLLAHNIIFDRRRSDGGISKRPANFGGGITDLQLSCSSSSNSSEEGNSVSASPPCSLPPLHPNAKRLPRNGSPPSHPPGNTPWRSFSLSDLQSVAAEADNISVLTLCSGNKGNKLP
ncbi:hypothetical protein L6164_013879 [Bauhinia variegata]|uniref:Uncharacterized protein n=1 Tax=Bauhinia variegata TaxID=167791 RepID=A0ACB9NKG4_BAUVA|nr:hypothetical protein L6164_013879 [Bauhinia variegata]